MAVVPNGRWRFPGLKAPLHTRQKDDASGGEPQLRVQANPLPEMPEVAKAPAETPVQLEQAYSPPSESHTIAPDVDADTVADPEPGTSQAGISGAGGLSVGTGRSETKKPDLYLAVVIRNNRPVEQVADLHLDELLHQMVEKAGTSDLHLAAGLPPILRTDGVMYPLPYDLMTEIDTQRIMYDILTDEQIQKFESTWELDFSYALGKRARFRVNIFKDKGSVAAALRLIPTVIPTLEDMGYPPILRDLTRLKRGLVLVTGPTGSGKSTTLASMINVINLSRHEHILTIEDPIEYLHYSKMSVISQRELGLDTKSFAAALKSAPREDPNVILVGEMRDLETMQLAITVAETGHLVFATLHTNSSASTVDRIVDGFPQGQQAQVRLQLANNLQAVICQTLVPRLDNTGRIGVLEIMIATPAIRNLIREAKAHQLTSVIQTSGNLGMITMDQNLRDHYLKGLISYDEAISRALSPDELKRMISEQQEEAKAAAKSG